MTVQINGDNTIAAPGFSGPDADTGLQTATNELSLVTGGSARLFIDSSGRVGVGTSSPQTTLHLSASNPQIRLQDSDGTNQYAQVYNSGGTSTFFSRNNTSYGPISLVQYNGTSSTTPLYIDSSQRVGVGTTSPGAPFDVISTRGNLVRFQESGSPYNGLVFSTDSTGATIKSNAGTGYLAFNTGNSESARIDSSGRVGIGTSSPSTKLHVTNGSLVADYILRADTSYVSIDANQGGTAAAPALVVSGDSDTGWYRPASNTIGLSTAGSERLRIDSSGNVGIGATSLTAKLQVVDGSNAALYIGNADAGPQYNNYYLSAQHIFRSGTGTDYGRFDASGRLLVGTSTARANFFNSSASAALQVEGTATNDRIAAVVSSSSTGASGARLVLAHQKSGTLGGNTVLASGDLVGGVNFQGSDGSEFVDAATITVAVDGTPGSNDMPGRLVFSTTADGASSPTERMRIDSTGAITQATQPILKTNATSTFGSSGSLVTTPASAIAQASAQFERGDNGWTTSGSNAYTFVCPVAGIYAVFANVSYGDIAQGNRVIWVMGYTLGGGSLPLSNYVEVLDHTVADYMNESYYDLWSFTAGTRVGMGFNGVSGSQSGYSLTWGMHLVA